MSQHYKALRPTWTNGDIKSGSTAILQGLTSLDGDGSKCFPITAGMGSMINIKCRAKERKNGTNEINVFRNN